jgi:hypothetical protein
MISWHRVDATQPDIMAIGSYNRAARLSILPLIIGEFDSSEKLSQLAIDRSILFALTVYGKLYVYDVADPKKMIRRGEPLDLRVENGASVQMKVLNGRLYIGYEKNIIIVHSY